VVLELDAAHERVDDALLADLVDDGLLVAGLEAVVGGHLLGDDGPDLGLDVHLIVAVVDYLLDLVDLLWRQATIHYQN